MNIPHHLLMKIFLMHTSNSIPEKYWLWYDEEKDDDIIAKSIGLIKQGPTQLIKISFEIPSDSLKNKIDYVADILKPFSTEFAKKFIDLVDSPACRLKALPDLRKYPYDGWIYDPESLAIIYKITKVSEMLSVDVAAHIVQRYI